MRCPGSRSTSRALAGLLALATLLSSCVSVTWNRESRYFPPDLEEFEQLEAGEATLTECLERLGAPLWVWEVSATEFAMAWGWYEDTNSGARVSIPFSRGGSASFRFDRLDERMLGLALFFDQDSRLIATRRGLLKDLNIEPARRRPVQVEDLGL
jgi:hypothetical protein